MLTGYYHRHQRMEWDAGDRRARAARSFIFAYGAGSLTAKDGDRHVADRAKKSRILPPLRHFGHECRGRVAEPAARGASRPKIERPSLCAGARAGSPDWEELVWDVRHKGTLKTPTRRQTYTDPLLNFSEPGRGMCSIVALWDDQTRRAKRLSVKRAGGRNPPLMLWGSRGPSMGGCQDAVRRAVATEFGEIWANTSRKQPKSVLTATRESRGNALWTAQPLVPKAVAAAWGDVRAHSLWWHGQRSAPHVGGRAHRMLVWDGGPWVLKSGAVARCLELQSMHARCGHVCWRVAPAQHNMTLRAGLGPPANETQIVVGGAVTRGDRGFRKWGRQVAGRLVRHRLRVTRTI